MNSSRREEGVEAGRRSAPPPRRSWPGWCRGRRGTVRGRRSRRPRRPVGVDRLGRRDAHVRGPQRREEALQRVLHGAAGRPTRSRRRRRSRSSSPSLGSTATMSCSNFSSTFSVSRTSLGSSAWACSRISARAQSTVSEIDGDLRSSSVAQRLHEGHQLAVQPRLDARHAGGDDALLQRRVGQGDVQVQAAALQRIAQVADVVGGQEHHRRRHRLDHAELGHRDLEGRQDLQQEGLEGLVATCRSRRSAAPRRPPAAAPSAAGAAPGTARRRTGRPCRAAGPWPPPWSGAPASASPIRSFRIWV